MLEEMGVGSVFWADPSCIQCRAEEWLADPKMHRDTIRNYTQTNPAIHHLYMATNRETADRAVDEAVRVGFRKGRAELRVILLDPHECGKVPSPTGTIYTSTLPVVCAFVMGPDGDKMCRLLRDHDGYHDATIR